MSRQYKRSAQVTLGGSGGSIDIEAYEDDVGHPDAASLRVKFKVQHAELGVPQHADIWIYNLSDATEQKIQKEFQTVTLKAGYGGDNQIIFAGELIQKRSLRENPVDTVMALLAKDSERAINSAVLSQTLKSGNTYRDQVDACLKALEPFGVKEGFIADLGSKRMPKCRVMHGMVRDLLRQIGQATNTAWSIQGGKLQMVKNDGFIPGAPIILNSRTGLIGRPEQTIDGIIVRCLLNPRIRPGTKLKIDQSSINQAAFSPAYTAEVNNAMIPPLATDGLYKVLFVDEDGDTRGPPWYTVATCIKATGGTIPLSLVPRGITDPTDVPGSTGNTVSPPQ